MGRKNTRARAAVLQDVPENEEIVAPAEKAEPVVDIMHLINNIETQMEERIASIVSAAEDAILSLKNDLKTKIVRLPKAIREMSMKQFQEKYPDDLKTGALQEIRQKYAAMAEAAQQAVPATSSRGTRTGVKRGAAAEPITVLRTVKTRRTASAMPTWGGPIAAEPAAPSAAAIETHQPAGATATNRAFNGLPLQTPLPFAGAAMPLPVTMLTQKRGGRTKAAAAPEAAVVTTADGMQWALGKEGMAAIPESHRAEVAEMLSAQFNFLAQALGKTVFDRPGGRSTRRG